MNKQTEALRLADALDADATNGDMGRKPDPKCHKRQAAAELRRLHQALAKQPAQQRTEELLEIFKDVDQCGPLLGMGQPAQQEPVATLFGSLPVYDTPSPAQPQQEPVAHQYQSKDGVWRDFISHSHYEATVAAGSWPIRALYTSPPAQRTCVGLTDIEYDNICGRHSAMTDFDFLEDIEAKLKEKNT